MRNWCTVVTSWALFAVLGGCLLERPQVPKPECEVNSDCSGGKICGGAGRCTDACSLDTDCQAPLVCTTGACTAPAGRCARDADCTDGKACANTFCATRCTDATACATGESCINGACALVSAPAGCRYDSECGATEACVQGRCGARCVADPDCAAPLTCAMGACVPPSGRCRVDADCASDEACAATLCAKRCTDASSCSVNQACLNGACATLVSGACRYNSECANGQACIQGRCAAACLAAADCAPGTDCRAGTCQAPTAGCFATAQCDAGLACAPTGSCVASCAADGDCTGTGQVCSNGACVTTGPGTATLTGQVVVTGVSDAGVFAVSVKGPNRLTGATRSDGTFSFAGLLPGLYDVSVTVPATSEGTLTREVAALAGASTSAGPFAFSPVGSARGRVTLQGRATHEGIGISALGTSRGTVTDPTGAFTLTDLPPGTYDLLATAPGYQAAQFQGVVVTWQGVTQASPDVQLAPVPAGSTFAFSSLPPTTARVGQPFVYTAVAGGGGVSAVTYVLEAGPTGMTLNPSTGQVSWAPAGTSPARPWVAISARGGSQVVYQYFEVSVLPLYEYYAQSARGDAELVDGGFWVAGYDHVAFVSPDGGARVSELAPAQSGTVTSVQLLNAGLITAIGGHRGTVSAVQAPAGLATVTWQGGTVRGVSSPGSLAISSHRLSGGPVASVEFPGLDRVQALTYPTGTPASVTVQTNPLTAVRARTGLVGTVTATTVTDPAAAWATGELTSTLCVSDGTASFKAPVTSHTATSITVNTTSTGPLDGRLAVGQRYFVILCSTAANNLQYVVESSAASFGSLTSPAHSIAMYSRSLHLATYAVAANTATTVTFLAPLSRWAEFTTLPASAGFFGVGPSGGTAPGVDVRVVDPGATFAAGLSTTSRVSFDAFTTTWPIVSNTATELVFRLPFTDLLTTFAGRNWILTTTAGLVLVELTTGNGNLPADIASSGERLWVDTLGQFFTVSSNTTTQVTVAAPLAQVPFTSWAGSELAWGPASAILPTTVVTDAVGGLTPNAYQGRWLQRLIGTTDLHRERPIASHDASRLTLTTGGSCSYLAGFSCVGALNKLRLAFAGARWVAGNGGAPQQGDFELTVAGTPNLAPNALAGAVVLFPTGTAATVLSNTANVVTVAIDETLLPAITGAAAPYTVQASSTGTGTPLVLYLESTGATWTVNQWVGFRVVAPNGVVAGRVFSNTADTVELELLTTSSSELDAASRLVPGALFAFAGAWPEGLGCTGGYSTRARADLAGATLTATAGTLRFANSSGIAFKAWRADATGGDLSVCPSNFDELLAGRGQQALLTADGTAAFSFTDVTASWATNELTGLDLHMTSLSGGALSMSAPTVTNTATTVSFTSVTPGTFFSMLGPYLVPGALFWFDDDDNEVRLTFTTTLSLPPSALKGRGVRLLRAPTSSPHLAARVIDNDVNRITAKVPYSSASLLLPSAGANQYRHVVTSLGQFARVTVGSPALTPGALVGETVRVGGVEGIVVANTATELTISSDDSQFLANVESGTTWALMERSVGYSGVTVSTAGTALAPTAGWFGEVGLFEVAADGTTTQHDPWETGRAFQATPVLGPAGTLTQAPVATNGFTTFSDPSWAFTPGALVGQIFVGPDCGSTDVRQRLIVANDATSVTVRGPASCLTSQVGQPWFIQTWRVAVSGATLQPNELAGRRVELGGARYRVVGNTSTELQLAPPSSSGTSALAAFSGEPLPFGGARLHVLEAFPRDSANDIVTLPTGYALASSSEVSRRDGSSMRLWESRDSATTLLTLTVTEALPTNAFRVTPATLTPGALVGKMFRSDDADFTIAANTADTVTLTLTDSTVLAPVPGRTYRVTENDGFSSIRSLAADGAVLWVAAINGLYKHDGAGWSRLSIQSTESAAGLADGLPFNDINWLSVTAPGELWLASDNDGVVRFSGGTWTRFTVASTESTPGAANGLASNTVRHVTKDAAGALWFAHASGVSRLLGTTWQQNFGHPVSPGSAFRVYHPAWGDTFVMTWSDDLYRVWR